MTSVAKDRTRLTRNNPNQNQKKHHTPGVIINCSIFYCIHIFNFHFIIYIFLIFQFIVYIFFIFYFKIKFLFILTFILYEHT